MFNWFEKKRKIINAVSCIDGILIPLKDVKDEVFSKGIIGRGVAITPISSKVVAPIEGTIKTIFPTNHAIGIETKDGLEFLIHIGIDTVKLNGEGFKRIASEGQNVKAGDVLVEVDLDMLNRKGYSTDILIILITDEEKADFQEVGAYGSKVSGNENVIFTCYTK